MSETGKLASAPFLLDSQPEAREGGGAMGQDGAQASWEPPAKSTPPIRPQPLHGPQPPFPGPLPSSPPPSLEKGLTSWGPHLLITSVGRRGSSKGRGAADDMYGRPWLNSLPGHPGGTWQLRGMTMAWTALGVEGNAAKH